MSMTTVIAEWPPLDGREWDCQCARCGSSVGDSEDCWNCGGEGNTGSACCDDLCHGQEECIHGDADTIPCDICNGEGAFPGRCLSDAEWCKAHPLPGREQTPRGTLEWFTLGPAA